MTNRSVFKRYFLLMSVFMLPMIYLAANYSMAAARDMELTGEKFAAASTFEISSPTIQEGDLTATFTITRSDDSIQEIVSVRTISGTAVGGIDYLEFISPTLTFEISESVKMIDVVITGDAVVEQDETFSLELFSGGTGIGIATVNDDDSANVSIVAAGSAAEDSGSITFELGLSDLVDVPVSVGLTTQDGSATTADNDYVALGDDTFVIPANTLTRTISVSTGADTDVEFDESFQIEISSVTATGRDVISGTGVYSGTLINDDFATVSLSGGIALDEPDGVITQVVTMTATLDRDVLGGFDISYSTSDESATGGDDYISTSGTLNFAGTMGETQIFTVTVNPDTVLEGDETFTAGLGTASAGPLASFVQTGVSTQTVTILDDDTAGVRLVSSSSASEGDGELMITAILTGDVQSGFRLPFTITDDSAEVADGDYVDNDGELTFLGVSGETQAITVTVNDDSKVETNEIISFTLGSSAINADLGSNVSNIGINTSPVAGTILNDDEAALTFVSVSTDLAEGDSGTQTISFEYQLDNPVQGGFGISYVTADGTATIADSDYQGTNGTLQFVGNANETQTIDVVINGDSKVEANETFSNTLGLFSNAEATILSSLSVDAGSESTLGTILNDDSAQVIIFGASSVDEGDSGTTNYVFDVILSEAVQDGFTIEHETTGLTATTPDNDYQDNDGVLTFAGTKGEKQQIIVKINGDTKEEENEAFEVRLFNFGNSPAVSSLSVGGLNPVIGEITNDDGTVVTLEKSSDVILEADTNYEIDVMLNSASAFTVTVDYSATSITATAGSDFTAQSGSLIFAPGDDIKTISVPILNDGMIEFDEAFLIELSNSSNATIGNPSEAEILIVDDDGLPTVSFSQGTYEVGEAGGMVPISITLSRSSGIPVTVQLSSQDDSATAGDDYTAVNRSVLIPAGETSRTVLLSINNDFLYERDETFTVTLSSLVNAEVGTHLDSLITILEDDAAPLVSIEDISVQEQDGLTDVVLNVTLSQAAGVSISVNYATQDGTATAADGDYLPASGTVVIPAGSTSAAIQISVLGDDIGEADETFSVILSAPSDGSLDPVAGASTGVAVLTNDDFFVVRLPLTRNGAIDGPDLIVSGIEVRSGQVFLTIKNVGNEAVAGAFWVDLFVNPTVFPSQPNDTIESLGQPGIVWLVFDPGLPLQPGGTLELTVGDLFYDATETNFSGNISAGSTLVAHVDSANASTNYGAIQEGHERVGSSYNNIYSSITEADLFVP
ncbi:MAG: Calx-beta domain-containing protein [Chloroflexota bacterium]